MYIEMTTTKGRQVCLKLWVEKKSRNNDDCDHWLEEN